MPESCSSTSTLVDALTTERDELKGKLTEAEANAAQLQEKVASVDALTAERDELTKKLETAEREGVILNHLRTENKDLMAQLEEAKKAQQAASKEVTSLRAQVDTLIAQLNNNGIPTRTKSGGRKPIKDPKRREEMVIVRDPRDRLGAIHIVRRRNLNSSTTRSSSQSEGSADA
ncbi:hypothetical protein NM208_g7706 [Fusarium decemcellulare]|uniref:Uncharacterized protein n=1 Tax=Fusarium decemcellulare TaxID=57161 RepID=A0ACC1S8B7_9HYPO|nr:hypothetical protein NM208_g7706 [Fusarium decemcellulare]